MDNLIGTTLIIGNGWDLNVGMETSFSAFFRWLTERKFWDKYANYSLIRYIKDKGERENWFDFEAIILDYAVNSSDSLFLRKIENRKEFDNSDYIRIRDNAEESLAVLKNNLVEFLTHKQPNFSKNAPAYWIMGAILGAYGKGREPLYDSLIKRRDSNGKWHFPNNRIVSFNYLNDSQELSIYLQFLEKVGSPIGIDSKLLEKLYFFIHNSLDFENIANLHPNIIFGTNDDERMPKAFYVLRKSYWLDNRAKERFSYILHHSKRIVIFGHSIQGIDYDYYREFFSIERPDTEIYVVSRNQEDLEKIRHGIEEKGSNVKIRYLAVDWVGDEDMKEFLELCKRIAEEQNEEISIQA